MLVQNLGANPGGGGGGGVNKVHYGRCASGVLSPFEFICSWEIGNKITQEL